MSISQSGFKVCGNRFYCHIWQDTNGIAAPIPAGCLFDSPQTPQATALSIAHCILSVN